MSENKYWRFGEEEEEEEESRELARDNKSTVERNNKGFIYARPREREREAVGKI